MKRSRLKSKYIKMNVSLNCVHNFSLSLLYQCEDGLCVFECVRAFSPHQPLTLRGMTLCDQGHELLIDF